MSGLFTSIRAWLAKLANATVATSGAGMVGMGGGLNYAAGTIGALANEHVSPGMFGWSSAASAAVNNTAMSAAITWANTLGVGVYVPGVAANVSQEFALPDGMAVCGDGWQSKIVQTVAGLNIFILGNNCQVSNLHLKFGIAGNNLDLTKQNAVYGSGKRNVSVNNCYLELVDIHCGVQLRDCTVVDITNNVIFGGVWNNTIANAAASVADILFYSFTAGGKATISGNMCLSNNSQGIYVDALGFDADMTISNNVCITMLPDMSAETAQANVTRRHGIIPCYTGGAQTRMSVTGNLCRNTQWTGIYATGSGAMNTGQVTISGNVCSKNGYDTSTALSAGIYVTSSGGEVVANNVVVDFQNTGAATGGVTLNCSVATGSVGALVQGNLICNSAANGIALGTYITDVVVKGNYVYNSTLFDVNIAPNSVAAVGGYVIEGNTMLRTNATSQSIVLSQGAATKRTYIRRNKIRGTNSGTLANGNSGIWLTHALPLASITENEIDGFYYGINSAAYIPAAQRNLGLTYLDRNTISNCTQGIGASSTAATATLICEGNVFENVATRLGLGNLAASACLYEGRRCGSKLEVFVVAVPAAGTWATGDRFVNQAGVVGQPKAWQCTVAGSPGTLTSEGVL